MNRLQRACLVAAALVLAPCAQAAGKLEVADAWIREAPPGATMMAGYANLANRGDARLVILAVESTAFESSSVHETVIVDGMSRMRELGRIDLDPGASVELAPGGKHLMLMQPSQPLAAGARVAMTFVMADNSRVDAEFVVRGIEP